MIALANHLPRVRVPWVPLGDWPTPLTALPIDGRPVWVKHEGDAHPRYGSNKLRTLELWFGHAQARGARRIWAIGAYGSNHMIATALHAPRAGLEAAAIVFPQPASEWAVENCGAIVAAGCPLIRLRSVVGVPFVGWRVAPRARCRGHAARRSHSARSAGRGGRRVRAPEFITWLERELGCSAVLDEATTRGSITCVGLGPHDPKSCEFRKSASGDGRCRSATASA